MNRPPDADFPALGLLIGLAAANGEHHPHGVDPDICNLERGGFRPPQCSCKRDAEQGLVSAARKVAGYVIDGLIEHAFVTVAYLGGLCHQAVLGAVPINALQSLEPGQQRATKPCVIGLTLGNTGR